MKILLPIAALILGSVLASAVVTSSSSSDVPTIQPSFTRPISSKGVGNLIVGPVRCDGLRCFMINETEFQNNYVLAFNASTGETLWKSPTKIDNPLNLPVAGHGVVAFAGHFGFHIEVFDQLSGDLKFRHELNQTEGEFVIAGPSINAHGLMFLTNNRTFMLNSSTGELLWENKKVSCPHYGTYNANRLAYDDSNVWVVVNTTLFALHVKNGSLNYHIPILDNNGNAPNQLTVQDNYAVSGLLLAWSTDSFTGSGYISFFDKKTGSRKWITPFTPSGSIFTSIISVSQKYNSFTIQEHDGEYSHVSTVSYDISTGKPKWTYGPYLAFNSSAPSFQSQTVGPNFGGDAYVFSTLQYVFAVTGSTGTPIWKSPINTAQNWANFGIATCPMTGTAFAVAPVSFDDKSVTLASWQINNRKQ